MKFGLRSRLEGVFDDKGEVEERKDEENDSEDTGVEDSRSKYSTNELR